MIRLVFLLIPALLSAGSSFKILKESPQGHVRDFQIWQYFQTDINASEADKAYKLVQNKLNPKILKVYSLKTDNAAIKKQYQCMQGDIGFLLNETSADCINSGLSYIKAMKLSNEQRSHFAQLLKKEHPKKSERIILMNETPFVSTLLASGSDHYLKLFNELGQANRQKYFNVKLSKNHINELAKDKRFERAIKYIVTDAEMDKMQESLLELDPHEFSAQSYFFLALNAIRFKATKKAGYYLEIAYNKAYYQMDKDKALFWHYLSSKNNRYLQLLAQSSDINIYSLYAREQLNIETNNYFSQLELDDQPSSHDLSDPYVWEDLLDKIRTSKKEALKKMMESFNNTDDEVINAFIYSKLLDYKVHNYIMPYKEATRSLSKEDKALLYALGRQESHFIPSAISRSYALGVMQMMPFLIKGLAKQKKESVKLEEMFNPYKNIQYAIEHLKYLKKYLYHPLFIAYAYNGGIGFTKRYLLKGKFSRGSFEPFLSMELMANSESREYAKKVLANYVIYKKILGDEVKITSLFQTLSDPIYTDNFRIKKVAKKGKEDNTSDS